MNLLCRLGFHRYKKIAHVYCDAMEYELGKECECGRRRISDWQQAAKTVSQAFTDGKMVQLLNQQKGN